MIEKFAARPMEARWGVYLGLMLEKRLQLENVAPAVYPATYADKASPESIAAAEGRLGFELDAQHKQILLELDGWPDGFAEGDLLSVTQLGQGEKWDKSLGLIGVACGPPALDGDLPPKESLYPIHFGDVHVPTVFAIDRSGPVSFDGHPVIWFDDHEVLGWWPNCFEFWLGCYTMLSRLCDQLVAKRLEGTLPSYYWQLER